MFGVLIVDGRLRGKKSYTSAMTSTVQDKVVGVSHAGVLPDHFSLNLEKLSMTGKEMGLEICYSIREQG